MMPLSPKKEDRLQLTALPYNMDLIEEGRQDGQYYSDSNSSYSSGSESNPSSSDRVVIGIVGRPFSMVVTPMVTGTPIDATERSRSMSDAPCSTVDGIPRNMIGSPRISRNSRYIHPVNISSVRSANLTNHPLGSPPFGSNNRPISVASRPYSTAFSIYSMGSRPFSTNSFDAHRRRRPQSMQLRHPISRYYPIFTIAISIAIWVSFILGIVLSDDLSLQSIGWHTPVSPPNNQWWFFTVAPFPSCTDERFKAWRVLSMQLVHGMSRYCVVSLIYFFNFYDFIYLFV
jgi:hypothetical protein